MNKKDEAKIRAMRKEGKSIKAIAREMHICDKRVAALFKAAKPVPASNKIEIPSAQKKPCKHSYKCSCKGKPEVKKDKPINLVWHNGHIAASSLPPAKLLVFGHKIITFALCEIFKDHSK